MSYQQKTMASKYSIALILVTLSLLLFATTISRADEEDRQCVYLIYVKTGGVEKAGTHSTISIELKTAKGEGISVGNLEEWGGIMGPNHNFYETGQLDIFSGMGPCLSSSICSMNLTSDGRGPYHGWYCDFVEVTTAAVGHSCHHRRFPVEQWLARDQEPFTLTAFKDYCHTSNAHGLNSIS